MAGSRVVAFVTLSTTRRKMAGWQGHWRVVVMPAGLIAIWVAVVYGALPTPSRRSFRSGPTTTVPDRR